MSYVMRDLAGLRMLIAALVIAGLAQAAQAEDNEIRGAIFDEKLIPNSVRGYDAAGQPVVVSWNFENFKGFWYDSYRGVSSEELTISTPNLGRRGRDTSVILDSDPTIGGASRMFYSSNRQIVRYVISKEKGIKVKNALDSTANKVNEGEYYAEIGLFGERYVALSANSAKISTLIIEQIDQRKTVYSGDTWEIGQWLLSADVMPFYPNNRKAVKITLSYKESKSSGVEVVKLDEKILNEEELYVYTENIGGETNVPLFVTRVLWVFPGHCCSTTRIYLGDFKICHYNSSWR